ncbi:MAG: MOSC domain-containing protein [Ignavibacteriaceae bacterium]
MIEEQNSIELLTPTNNVVGKIAAISISKKKGIPKTNVMSAKMIDDFGIEGDAHAGKWHRQVSLLPLESVDKMRAAGLPNLRPGAFAENLTIEGIELNLLPIGTKIIIDKNVLLEVTQIGKECHSKCAIFIKVGDCVMPREGIFAKVIKGGDIFIGDKIEIANSVKLTELSI